MAPSERDPRNCWGNWERLLVAKGLKVSGCRAQLPAPGFYGYLRLPFGLRSRRSGPEAGLPLPPDRAQPWVKGSRNGMASSAGGICPSGGGRGARGEKLRARPSVSQLKSLPCFLPKGGWGTVSCQKVKGVEGKQERGHTHHPHPLSPGQLACWATASLPCCPGRQGPRVWAVPTSLLGWAAG